MDRRLLLVALLALALLPTAQGVVITDKLVARYDFDEGAGATLGDLSGFDNNGTLIGSPSWITTRCLSGSCLNLTGTGMYVNITSSGSLTGWNNFTIAGWVNFNKVSSTQYILSKDKASAHPGRAYGIYLDGANNLNYEYWNSTGGAGSIVSDPHGVAINTSQAVCFAFTRDATQSSNNLKVYYDGVLQSTGTGPNGPIASDPSTPMQMGRRGDGTGQTNGSIDRIWIFNRTLTSSEMTTLCSTSAVDTTPPTVNITSPTNTTYNATSVWVNVTLNENSGNVTAQLDSATNYTLTNTSGNWNRQLTGLAGGAHNVRVFANDSNGNMNSSQIIYFAVDNTAPTITIGSPTNTTYNTTTGNLTLNVTADEAISVWRYSLNDATNVSFTPNTTFIAASGANKLIINANDTTGNNGSATIYFTVNTSVTTNITLFDEVTEATVIGTGKWTVVTLRYSDTYASNATYNATNGTALFTNINNSGWVVDAGSTGSDFPYPRTTLIGANQLTATIYLIPSGADSVYVVFTLNDPSGAFNGALVKLKKYINNSLIELSRTNFDAANNAPFYMLKNNRYQLFINNSNEERNLGWYIPTASATQTITINNVSLAPTVTLSTKDVTIAVNYTNASNFTGTIGFQYRDALNKTNGVEFWVYNGTNESDQLYYTSGNSSIFSAIYTGIANTNITYLTKWRVNHSTYGQLEGRQLVSMFNMALRVGLGSAFSQRWHYTLVAMLVIIFTAGIFTARTSSLGGTFLMGEILLFSWWGWLQLSGLVISVLGLLVLVAMLTKRGGI